eukprot:TRINITY_DN20731_c0_g1_i1.p1 TRINITY_DN20731_c0_g1~~TRINITY_DN20731_c0_g1_i1.p1  ORF type:complete len:410 (-),score=88.15 TRINITY_DN20731_c0_g1_i1:91-1320(-)
MMAFVARLATLAGVLLTAAAVRPDRKRLVERAAPALLKANASQKASARQRPKPAMLSMNDGFRQYKLQVTNPRQWAEIKPDVTERLGDMIISEKAATPDGMSLTTQIAEIALAGPSTAEVFSVNTPPTEGPLIKRFELAPGQCKSEGLNNASSRCYLKDLDGSRACDDDELNAWCNEDKGDLTITFDEPVLATYFSFTTAARMPGWDPADFAMYARVSDADEWVLLRQDTNYSAPTDRNFQTEWFRLGSGSGGKFSMYKWEMQTAAMLTDANSTMLPKVAEVSFAVPKAGAFAGAVQGTPRFLSNNIRADTTTMDVVNPGGDLTPPEVRDGDVSTAFEGNTLNLVFTQPVEPTFFTFVTSDDAARDPVQWTLSGKTEEGEWVELSKVTSEDDPASSFARQTNTRWFRLR